MPALPIELPYSTETIVLVLLVVVVSTAISAIAGFGFGTISVPLLLLFVAPSSVVVITKVVGTGTAWIILFSIWRRVQWRTVVRILPAAFVGLVVGGIILRDARPAAIQLGVGVLVLISVLTLITRPILIEDDSLWATSLVGFLTGVMGNATGLLAPAVVVYFTGRQFPKDVFRATTITLFLVVDLVGLPTLAVQGAVSVSDLQIALLLVPFAVTGRMIGWRLARHVSQTHFRRVTMVLLFVIAALSIGTALQELW